MSEVRRARCPLQTDCPFFRQTGSETLHTMMVNLYCEQGARQCEIRRLLEAGKPVPPGIWPDGDVSR